MESLLQFETPLWHAREENIKKNRLKHLITTPDTKEITYCNLIPKY